MTAITFWNYTKTKWRELFDFPTGISGFSGYSCLKATEKLTRNESLWLNTLTPATFSRAYGMFDCTLLAFTRPQLPVLMDLFCLFFALKKGPKLIYYIPSYQAISQLDFDQLSKLIIFYCTLS